MIQISSGAVEKSFGKLFTIILLIIDYEREIYVQD